MILAELPWLPISITILTTIVVIVSLLMILVVMMQRPKQEGLGAAFGAGMTDQLLGAGTTSFLQKATVWLGVLFFLISLVLAILVAKQNQVTGKIADAKSTAPIGQAAAPDVLSDPADAPVPGLGSDDAAMTPDDEADTSDNLNILESLGVEPDSAEDAEDVPAEGMEEDAATDTEAPEESAPFEESTPSEESGESDPAAAEDEAGQ